MESKHARITPCTFRSTCHDDNTNNGEWPAQLQGLQFARRISAVAQQCQLRRNHACNSEGSVNVPDDRHGDEVSEFRRPFLILSRVTCS